MTPSTDRPTHVALLRAVNVAKHNAVPMVRLVEMFEELGLAPAQSLLQSGNVVFRGRGAGAALEKKLERETAKRLGVETDYLVRTAQEWAELVERLPFAAEARKDPAHLLALVLKSAPPRAAEKALNDAIVGPEYARIVGSCAYVVYPEGIGRSKLTSAVLARALGKIPCTGRNWNTVLKIAAKLG